MVVLLKMSKGAIRCEKIKEIKKIAVLKNDYLHKFII